METLDLWGRASLDPRDLIGRIYVEDHLTLIHTKYISCKPHGFREDLKKKIPIISLWELYFVMAKKEFQSIWSKNLMQPFPLPDDALYN